MVEGSYLAPIHERNTLCVNLCVIEYPMGVIIDFMMSSVEGGGSCSLLRSFPSVVVAN